MIKPLEQAPTHPEHSRSHGGLTAYLRSDHVAPGIRRVLECLDTPAMVTNDLGEVLAQNRPAIALFGDESRYQPQNPDRSRFHRWFTDPAARAVHPAAEHDRYSRSYVAVLRLATGRHPDDPHGRAVVDRLLKASPEFASRWDEHDVTWRPGPNRKTFLHPEVGTMELDCEELFAHNDSQIVLVYTPVPGTTSAERLRLLTVIGHQTFAKPNPS